MTRFLKDGDQLPDMMYFLYRSAFVVSHKTESRQILLEVVWPLPHKQWGYLYFIIVVTNGPEQDR